MSEHRIMDNVSNYVGTCKSISPSPYLLIQWDVEFQAKTTEIKVLLSIYLSSESSIFSLV